MWHRVKLFFLRWMARWALKGRWYYHWSRIYQFLFERRRIRKYRIPAYTSLPEGVESTVRKMKWRKDTWVMLFDAISHPKATFGRHQEGMKAGDCDDISLFAAWAVRDMMSRGWLKDFRFVGLLSVPWIDDGGKTGGHNVCVVSYVDRQVTSNPEVGESTGLLWAHMSNWHGGRMQTHGRDGEPFRRVEDVVMDVLSGPGRSWSCVSVGWARADCDLNPVEYGDGRTL